MNVAVHPGLRPLDFISLCTGGGGLDLGLELAIPGARPVCLVEREAFAVAHLVEAMRQGLMAPAPVWSDARTFRGREWRGLVDGVIGGIPCQPHSLAGKRLGEEDERDLWSTARRIIVQSGAWFVLIENVGGMLSSGGAERVWRDLRRLGFAVEAGLFTAAEVGASHQRERLFILGVADAANIRRDGYPKESRSPSEGLGGGWLLKSPRDRCALGDATIRDGAGLGQSEAHHASPRFGKYRGPGRYLFPPGPGDIDGWRDILAGAPHLEPSLRRVADGLAPWLDDARIERLRMLGNGVVPLEAGYAVRTLLPRLAAAGSSAAAFLVRVMEGSA